MLLVVESAIRMSRVLAVTQNMDIKITHVQYVKPTSTQMGPLLAQSVSHHAPNVLVPAFARPVFLGMA